MGLSRHLVIGCALLFSTAASATAASPGLVGHTAHYDIRLSSVQDNSGIIGARGETDYRFADSCDGWIVENRSRIVFQYAQGGSADTEWVFSAWESKDGRKFRFNVRQSRNGKVVEDIKGSVNRDEAGAKGIAEMEKPADAEVYLPNGTLFPTEHTKAILRAAEGGEGLLRRTLFDGSGLDNPFDVNALIGKVKPASLIAVEGGEPFGLARNWSVRMAFFGQKSRALEPKFEMELKYREDGVATRIIQDFEDFSLDAVLDKITKLPKPDC